MNSKEMWLAGAYIQTHWVKVFIFLARRSKFARDMKMYIYVNIDI